MEAVRAGKLVQYSPARNPQLMPRGSLPVSPVFTKCSAMESEGGIAHGAWGSAALVAGGAVGVRLGAVPSGAEWSGAK